MVFVEACCSDQVRDGFHHAVGVLNYFAIATDGQRVNESTGLFRQKAQETRLGNFCSKILSQILGSRSGTNMKPFFYILMTWEVVRTDCDNC